MATTVRFYPSHSNSIHYKNIVSWTDLVNDTYVSAPAGTAGSKNLNISGDLNLRFESGLNFASNDITGGQKWEELSRLAFLFNTTSLPDTLSITGVTLNLKIRYVNNSVGVNWHPNYKISPYDYNPDSTSTIAITEYDNFANILLANEIDDSDLGNAQTITFTFTDTAWVKADAISSVGVRFDLDTSYNAPPWMAEHYTEILFYDHNSATSDRPYIDVTYEDATNLSETFDERVGTPITTAPGSVTGTISTLSSDLSSYWNMNNDWDDSKGDNDGTATNAVFSEYSQLGSHAGSFDGSGDYVVSDNHNIASLESFSVSLWLQHTSTENSHHIPLWISDVESTPNFLYIELGANYNYLGVATETFSQNKYSTADSGINDGKWHHIVVTRNSGTVLIYQDGSVISTTTHNLYGSWTTGSGKDLSLGVGMDNGNIYGSSYFTGLMDEVGMWERVLTASEVVELYNDGIGMTYTTTGFVSGSDGDPYWYNTTLLINAEYQSFQDKSPSDHTITAVGDAGNQYNEAYVKYGTGSMFFADAGDYLSIPDSPDFDFGTGDWTIECWIYMNSYGETGDQWGGIITFGPYPIVSQNINNWRMYSNTGKLYFAMSGRTITSANALAKSTWHHISLVRQGTSLKQYINGVLDGSTTLTSGFNFVCNGAGVHIGSSWQGYSNHYWDGYIDDFRITKGIARYTGDFSPPAKGFKEYAQIGDVSTYGGDPNFGDVSAYYKFNSGITDHSLEDPVIRTYREPVIDTEVKKAGVGSLKVNTTNPAVNKSGFDIRGDSVNFGTDDYTIESWVRIDSKPTYSNVSTEEGILVDFRETVTDSSETPLDGVLEWVGVENVDTSGDSDDEDFEITYKLKGSTEVHTGKELTYGTPTASPDEHWDNVVFLLQSDTSDGETSFSGTGKGDHSDTPHTVTRTNDTYHETDGAKAGMWDSSIKFDGTGDKLTITGDLSDFTFGNDPYTIEFWFYRDAVSGGSGYSYFFDWRPSGGGDNYYPSMFLNGSNQVIYYQNGAFRITSSALSLDTWYHVALVRTAPADIWTLYINGKSHGTYTNDQPHTSTTAVTIGDYGVSGGYVLNGYINDFRITKGIARYSGTNTSTEWSNFDEIDEAFITSESGNGNGGGSGNNSATGGTITTSGDYTVHTFTAGGTFTVADNAIADIEYLIVAGGAGGGTGLAGTGGGGAGGLLTNLGGTKITRAVGNHTITVGAGGAGGNVGGSGGWKCGSNGIDSTFAGLTSIGGGGGSGSEHAGAYTGEIGHTGGSGGGACYTRISPGSSGTTGQGYGGGMSHYAGGAEGTHKRTGGGGGGAGGAGADSTYTVAGNGGVGLSNAINGTATYYAGGGGGTTWYTGGTTGTGGNGGGANGGVANSRNSTGGTGTANTGGGGGGGSNDDANYDGGPGGSGIVIIRYATSGGGGGNGGNGEEGEQVVNFERLSVSRRTPYYPEMITNTDFEVNTTGWNANQNATLTRVNYNGRNVLKGTMNQTSSTPGVKQSDQNISVKNNSYYRMSAVVDTGNIGSSLVMYVRGKTTNAVLLNETVGVSGEWTEVSAVFKTTSETALDYVLFYTNMVGQTSGDYFYIDDVTLTEVTAKQYIHWGGDQLIALDTPPTKFEGQPIIFGTSEQPTPNGLNTYWDDLRITSGTNRYTVDYTLPISEHYTYAPPVLKGDKFWDETVLYLNADKSSILDSSTTGHSITTGGTPSVDFSNYKIGVGAIFFDGSTDYLIVGDHANWDFGTGDFTIEFWIRLTSSESQGWIFGWDGASGTNSDWKVGFGNSTGSTRQVEFYDMVSNSSSPIVSLTSLANDGSTWHHVAICRRDNEHKIFLDGSLDKTTTYSGTQSSFNNVTVNRYIGQSASDTTKRFGGYLDEIRITKGIARYSTTVDLQTEPYPILAEYADYQGEDITIDADEKSFVVTHGYENADTIFSNNMIQFIGDGMTIIPEISHDPHSANTTALASSDATYDNDELFRYQIRDTNSSIIRDVTGSDNKHTYFSYQFDGQSFLYHKIAIAGFQTGGISDLWDADNLRGVPDPNINTYESDSFNSEELFLLDKAYNASTGEYDIDAPGIASVSSFTANQFIFNAGNSFHICADDTASGTLGSTVGTSDYIPGTATDSTDVETESHSFDAMQYTADAELTITSIKRADGSYSFNSVSAVEEMVIETSTEGLDYIIDPVDSWIANNLDVDGNIIDPKTNFGSNFEFSNGNFEGVHDDFYQSRNDTVLETIDPTAYKQSSEVNDLGDYEFGYGEVILNPRIIRTLMGASAYSAEEQTIEETFFEAPDYVDGVKLIAPVSYFTDRQLQPHGNEFDPVFDERYSYAYNSDFKDVSSSLQTDLVSYYQMENTWDDSHGSNHGTPTGGANFLSGNKSNGTFSSDFSNGGYTTLDNHANFDFQETGNFSYSFWFKLNGNAVWSEILNKRNNSDYTAPWQIGFESRYSTKYLRSFMGTSGTGAIQTGTNNNISSPTSWNHAVFTIEGTTTKLYVNGSLDDTTTFTGTRQSNNIPIRIGGSYSYGSSNYPTDGLIDEVGFWSRALSSSEITSLYNGGLGLPFKRHNTIFLPDNTISLDYSLVTTLKTEKAVAEFEEVIGTDTFVSEPSYQINNIMTNIMARREQFSSQGQDSVYDTRYAESTVSTGTNGEKYENASGAVDAYFDLVQYTNEGFSPLLSISANNDRHAVNGGVFQTQLIADEVEASDTEVAEQFDSSAQIKTYFEVDIPEDPNTTGDLYFGDVVLLAQSLASNNSTDFTVSENSLGDHTLTAQGNMEHSTDISDQFGGDTTVFHFDGTGDSLVASSSTEFILPDEFTMEAWIYIANAGGWNDILASTNYYDTSYNGNWVFRINTSNQIEFRIYNGQTGVIDENSTDTVSHSTWHHVAVTRNSSNRYDFWLNGTSIHTFTNSTVLTTTPDSINIGEGYTTFFTGYMDDVRITKNVARYTDTFTKPTVSFQTGTNVSDDDFYDRNSLLLQSDTSNDSIIFADGSANQHLISQVEGTGSSTSDVHHDSAVKYFGNSSIQFDGNGDGLITPIHNDFNFGISSYTIECWVWFNNVTNSNAGWYDRIWSQGNGTGTSISLDILNNGKLEFRFNDSLQMTSSDALVIDQWYHIAFVRNQDTATPTCKIYVDGEEQATYNVGTQDHDKSSYPFYIGVMGENSMSDNGRLSSLDGYIDDFRITRHEARYTGDFTKPADPFDGSSSTLSNQIGTELPEFEMEESAFQSDFGQTKSFSYDNFTPETFQFDGSGSFVYCVDEGVTSTRNLDGTIGSQKKSQYKFVDNTIIPAIHYDTYKDGSGSSSDYTSSFAIANKPLLTGSTTVNYTRVVTTYHPAVSGAGDEHWDDVSLLIQSVSDGDSQANGSTTFVDTGPTEHAITLVGDIKHVTNQYKFGSSSFYFDGTGDLLRLPAGEDDFALGTGAFTVEYWFRSEAVSVAPTFYDYGYAGGGARLLLQDSWNDNKDVVFYGSSYTVAGSAYSDGSWTHFAIVRESSGGAWRMYRNGAKVGSGTNTDDIDKASAVPTIGGDAYTNPPTYFYKGWMDQFRITKGVTRYTGSSTTEWGNFDEPDVEWATQSSGEGTDAYTTTANVTTTPDAKDHYRDYKYRDPGDTSINGTTKYWGNTIGALRPYTTAPNIITKGVVDKDVGNYLIFNEEKIKHSDSLAHLTNKLDVDGSSETYGDVIFVQEIELVGKYRKECFQFIGGESQFIIDARWTNDQLHWLDSQFNAVTEGGTGYNTTLQFVDNMFANTISKEIVPSGIEVRKSAGLEEVTFSEGFDMDSLIPARDYFGSSQVQFNAGDTFAPNLDITKHFDIETAEGQFYALASGTFVDITSLYDTSTAKLTLTFSGANQMSDYVEGDSAWVGRFEASASGQSVTITSNKLYVIDSVNTTTLKMVLNVPTSEVIFDPPTAPGAEVEGDVTIITSSQNLAQLYYLLQGI